MGRKKKYIKMFGSGERREGGRERERERVV